MRLALLCFSLFLSLLTNKKEWESETGTITIQYTGEHAKPNYKLILYLKGSVDTAYEEFYIHKIEVTKSEFDRIVKAIKCKYKQTHGELNDPMAFEIITDGAKTLVLYKSVEKVEEIFGEIKHSIADQKKKESVSYYLDEMIMNLKVYGKQKDG